MDVKWIFPVAFLMMFAVGIMGMFMVYGCLTGINYTRTFAMNSLGEFWVEFILINLLFIGGIILYYVGMVTLKR